MPLFCKKVGSSCEAILRDGVVRSREKSSTIGSVNITHSVFSCVVEATPRIPVSALRFRQNAEVLLTKARHNPIGGERYVNRGLG